MDNSMVVDIGIYIYLYDINVIIFKNMFLFNTVRDSKYSSIFKHCLIQSSPIKINSIVDKTRFFPD